MVSWAHNHVPRSFESDISAHQRCTAGHIPICNKYIWRHSPLDRGNRQMNDNVQPGVVQTYSSGRGRAGPEELEPVQKLLGARTQR